MRKLHVFVNKAGNVVATGPAPAEVQTKNNGTGPIYMGFGPANGDEGFSAFELDVDEATDLTHSNPDVGAFHGRLAQLIRTSKDLKRIEFREQAL